MKTILVDAWNTFVTENGINKELNVLLDTFSNPKIILTNANEQERVSLGIVNMPYPVFSLDHNPDKTDKTYFEKMLAYYNLKPNNVVYFEHNPNAVNSAISVGITTYHFKKNEDLQHLASFLKKNL